MKNYRLYHPNKAGGVKDFYGRLGDFMEDNSFKFGLFVTSVFHPATTNELLEFGRVMVNFGMNGDSGNIRVSTDSNGRLHLKAEAKDELSPSLTKAWDSLYEFLVEDGWLRESEGGAGKPNAQVNQPAIIDAVQVNDIPEIQSVNPDIEERRKLVVELKQYGHDDKYVANKLSVTTKTVQRDKEALGILKHRKKGH